MRDECNYCKRHIQHGGKCLGKEFGNPCLGFEKDPRGCRKYLEKLRFDIPFGRDIPCIGKSYDHWEINGITKTITFTKIHKVEWHRDGRGLHGIRMLVDIWIWSHENGELPPNKPKLRLIKNDSREVDSK